MPQHSQEVAKQFEQQCMWVHQSWQTRKCLFDNKSYLPTFQQPHYEHFFLRLSIILQEYWMQQVAKLHDPAGKPGQANLSVDYMIECGDWDDGTKTQLNELRKKMLPFAAKMKTPRNKLLAHNDVATGCVSLLAAFLCALSARLNFLRSSSVSRYGPIRK